MIRRVFDLLASPDVHLRVVLVLLTVAAITVAAMIEATSPAIARPAYGVPLSGRPTVVTGFDDPPQRWQPGHRGIDLASSPGAPVLAAGPGRVRYVGQVAGRPVISITHPDGLTTTYEPVAASVTQGSAVARGEVIGTVESGHPGCPVATCLHWGARRGSGHTAEYVNPLGLIGAVRLRLKPVDP